MTAFLPILIGLVVLALQGPPATVTLDVTVADDKGQPVPGLDAGSFRVIVDDGPRRVTAVELPRTSQPAEALLPPLATRSPPGRAATLPCSAARGRLPAAAR